MQPAPDTRVPPIMHILYISLIQRFSIPVFVPPRTGIENRCSNQKHRIQHISLLLETLKKLGMSNNGNIQHMHCWGHQGWEALLMIQAYLCLESKSFEVVQDTLVQTQGVGWWFVFDGEDEDDGAWRLLPGVWKFIRRNSTGSVGWWEGNSLPLGRLPFLASDSALFLKEIHHILQDKPVFGQSEQHCKRPSTHARDAHLNVTRPGVVRAASTACLRYGSSACSHLSGWLLQWKRREGEQRVSTQNKHRSPCHKSWYSERHCIW